MASSPNQPPNAEGFDTRQGTLIEFSNNPWRRLSAFRCGTHSRALIVIGGVTDTFFSLNYIDCLTESMVQAAGYSVVQPLFSSWFAGYEESTLANDTEELDGLMVKLAASGVTEVALLGHGTGAQDCMHYLSVGNHAHMVNRLILQGGIQDPEAGDLSYEMKQNYRDEAVRLIRAGRGNSLMPAEAHPLPVSAFRYMALGGRHSASDFFNPTQPLDDMQLVLGHITVPCLVLFCLTDKYCPSGERRQEIMDKIQECIPADARFLWLNAACDEHLNFLRGNEEEITYSITTFLQSEDRKAKEREADKLRGELAEDKRKRSVVFQGRSGGLKRSPSQVSVTSAAR